MRILVVEDERKVANFISQGLQEEGHTVEVAKDGEAALDLLENGPPYDLIVLDVMLPRLGGFAVLRAARAARVRSPVLMLTARDAVADKVAGLDFDPESNVVDVYVGYLRRKIDGPGDGRLLHTVRGAGYVLRPDAD